MIQPDASGREVVDPLLQPDFQARIMQAMHTEQHRAHQALGDTAAFQIIQQVPPNPEPGNVVYAPGSRVPDVILDIPDLDEPSITVQGILLGLYDPKRIRSPRPRYLQKEAQS